jgi:hypothetical protein
MRRRPGTLVATAGALALLLVALLVGLTGGSGPTTATPAQASATPPAAAPATPVTVAGVALFHPGGSDDDHPGDVRLAADGNPATAWTTQRYATPTFGNLRPGVGLVFDLGTPVAVTRLRLTLTGPGAAAQVHAGSDPGRLLTAATVAGHASAPASWQVTPKAAVTARYWLVWFTRLPGSGQIGVTEATFAG